MLTAEKNARLTQVGPGTPAGELLRRYWHPVAAVSQMQAVHTRLIRILGEDLVLYRDRSDAYGLIGPRCPHRGMGLIYGVPQETGLRCPYHGWVFDQAGCCTEQPYEDTEDHEGSFRERVRIKAYPVREQAGLLMAYLGPEPAPLLPRWDVYTIADHVRDIGYLEIPCNWLQIQENSLDPVHLEWLHSDFTNYVLEQQGRIERMKPKRHVKIGFDVFEYGIVKRRVVEGNTEEDSGWVDGHPIVFPNMLRQGGSGDGTPGLLNDNGPQFQIRVPIDDTHTAHWWVAAFPRQAGDPEQKARDIPFYHPVIPDLDGDGQPRWETLDANAAQDGVAWITQGPVADRAEEHLGRSDKGIILFRQMLEENIQKVERGEDPLNVFRDPTQNSYLSMRTERRGGAAYASVLARQGSSHKFSPILAARDGRQAGELLQADGKLVSIS